jgi:hypothetical protein
LTRLIASNQITCDMTLQVTSLTAASLTGDEGNPVTVTSSIVRSLRRGDARADQVINIADAMFIAQGLAGLRTACTGTEDATCMHSVNAASVRPDGAFDRTTIADARFIARYLTGLMDEIYQFIP